MNKVLIIVLGIIILGLIVIFLLMPGEKSDDTVIDTPVVEDPIIDKLEVKEPIVNSSCTISEMIFYHSEYCGYCKDVWRDGSIDYLKSLGVDVDVRDVNKDKIDHSFEGVPTFVIGGEVMSGYRNTNKLKELLGCE
jgi:hypothetical protein